MCSDHICHKVWQKGVTSIIDIVIQLYDIEKIIEGFEINNII